MSNLRHSLSTRLSLGVLLMAIPVFVAALGILYLQSRNFIRQEAMAHASSVLNTQLQRVRNYMSTVETATNSSAWLAEEYFQPDSLLSISRRIVTLNSHALGCFITAEPGTFPQLGDFSACSYRRGDTIITEREAPYNYYETPWYKAPRQQGKACWVDPYGDYDEGTLYTSEMIASYCRPLHGADGRVIGIIATDLSFQKLAKAIERDEHPYPNAYFVLIASDGRYLLHPDTTRVFSKNIFEDRDPSRHTDMIALGHEMTAGNEGNMHITIDGRLCHVSYRPVPGTSWSLALICPDDDILQRYHQLTYIIIALIIVGLLFIVWASYRIVRQTIRPLNSLLGQLQAIAGGHYDKSIAHTDREDAIGQLQNSFATMQQSLHDHVGSISKAVEQTRVRNEELVRITALAEEAVRQKAAFIQDVSHQIRTPLNIIMGFADVLRGSLSSLGGESSATTVLAKEEVANITDMMRYNSAHLTRMVLMLYDSSDTGSAEEQQLKRNEQVSPNAIVRECIAFTLQHFPDLPIRFETDVDDDFRIPSNHLYLMRTLRELLYNAAKYSDGQHISVHVALTPSTVRFVTQDVGPGLPEESLDVIFNPFIKVNNLSEGLGLGLYLSRRHAKNLGGDLVVDTTYHAGCRLILEVPR